MPASRRLAVPLRSLTMVRLSLRDGSAKEDFTTEGAEDTGEERGGEDQNNDCGNGLMLLRGSGTRPYARET